MGLDWTGLDPTQNSSPARAPSGANNDNCLFKVMGISTKATRQKLEKVTDTAAPVCFYDPQFTIVMLKTIRQQVGMCMIVTVG